MGQPDHELASIWNIKEYLRMVAVSMADMPQYCRNNYFILLQNNCELEIN